MPVIIHSKPSGTPSDQVYDSLLEVYPELVNLPEHGLVHRLDTGTSGCLAFARDLDTYQFLRRCFNEGHPNLIKRYQALVVVPASEIDQWIRVEKKTIRIDYPIARLKKTAKKVKVLLKPTHTVGIRGEPRPALTEILSAQDYTDEILGLSQKHPLNPVVRFLILEIQIQTGMMHQIRAHLSALGAGILGDPIYPLSRKIREDVAPGDTLNPLQQILRPERFSRFYLHSHFLQLPLPTASTLAANTAAEKTVSKTISWDPLPELREIFDRT